MVICRCADQQIAPAFGLSDAVLHSIFDKGLKNHTRYVAVGGCLIDRHC